MRLVDRMMGRVLGTAMLIALAVLWFGAGAGLVLPSEGRADSIQLQRLTFSKEETLLYPSMDEAGKVVAYRHELLDPAKGEKVASIRVLQVDGLAPKVVFTDGSLKAPPPHEAHFLVCGTKPPVISGGGGKVIFSVSLGAPVSLEDHYLGVANADGSDLEVLPLRNEALAGQDWRKLGFMADTWRSLSQYRVSNDGRRFHQLAVDVGQGAAVHANLHEPGQDVGAVDATALADNAAAEIADKLLGRSIGGGADGGRTVTSALRRIRNRVAIAAGP